jgi:hypothetical protein
MKNVLTTCTLFATLAVGLGFGANRPALAQSSPSATLSAAQVKALATGIMQGDNCPALHAIDGMDQVHALKATRDISNAIQGMSPGASGVVVFQGDPGNVLVTFNYINLKGPNLVAYYVLFSNAHPVVDDKNSACSF